MTTRSLRLLLLLAIVAPSACDDGDEPERPAEVEGPRRGGTAVVAEMSDMAMPLPLYINTVIDGDMQDILFLSLLRTTWEGEEGRATWTAEEHPMALARSYDFLDADSTTIRFHLRSDARWSDGRAVTADDVVWTYRMLADPAVAAPRRDYVEHMDSVVAADDSTVTFHFQRRYPEMVFHTGHAVVPRHVFADATPAEIRTHRSVADPAAHLVFSGPFRLVRWNRGQQIVLEPNPHFHPQPLLDRLVIRIIPDENTRLVELQTGGIDAMRLSSPANITRIDSSPGVRLERIARRFSEFVAYNPAFPPFADPSVRRALGLAVDVPALIDALELDGYADRAASVYSPIFTDLQDPSLAPLPYAPEEAREILDARGWIDGDGDGIRERDGVRFSFTLASNAGNQRRADLATLLQSYWAQVGVEALLQQQEFQSFTSRIMAGEFEAVVYGWQVSLAPDLSGMWAPEAVLNFVSYDSPELQRLMEAALGQRTEEEASPHWRAAAAVIARDQPYTWLYYMDQVIAVRDRLRGPEIDTYGMYQNVWEWWVTDAGGGDPRPTAAQSVPSAN